MQIRADDERAWYNKACCYALQGKMALVIPTLEKAISLNPDYREQAKTDSDFDKVRHQRQFNALL
ncbi:MAG: hypothetical protein DRR08_25415 [Candidatus Parabeggiatoa sp. nov. 2]|nr:MAG: hypothetical protein DRR08_25415 [Gammaproteobacteria bacterium]HEC84244.1 hypothetical protein [Thioploca sp.]